MNRPEQRKIKIIFGVNDFLVGGMQRQFAEQTRWFDRKLFDIALISLFQYPGHPDLYDALPPDIPVYRLRFSGLVDIKGWWALWRLLHQLDPDVIVSSLFISNTLFRLLKPCRSRSIPREHNTYVDKPWRHRLVDCLLAKYSSCIVANSHAVADFTARQEGIPRRKFRVICNGIDTAKVDTLLSALPPKEVLRQELGIGEGRCYLNVARLVAQKNHRLLIDGFLRFRKTHPADTLLIVGDGELRESLERQVAEAGGQGVRFYGMRSDVWKFYKAADVFVLSSDIEGFSNTCLEALASGIPVVVTPTGGTEEFLREGENGTMIRGRTPQGVSDALERISMLSSDGLQECCKATARSFDVRETVRQYESLFREIV